LNIHGLILAAGLSSRMGAFKPLMRIRGQSLLALSVESLLAGGATKITVVLGYRARETAQELEELFSPGQVQIAFNPAFTEGDMLTSVKVGVAALSQCDAFFLLPGDMPAVSQHTLFCLRDVMEQKRPAVAFPTLEGYRKHPPLISVTCRQDILNYRGTGGLRGFWSEMEGIISEVPVTDEGCLMDADTLLDYERLTHYLTLRNPQLVEAERVAIGHSLH
jgi:CTP:molybdopterin cytidylyltransferase MocA